MGKLKFKTVFGSVFDHILLAVSYDDGATWTAPKYCGDTWCDGACGNPGLVFTLEGRTYRAHGAQVAMGRVFQQQRSGKQWSGLREEVPAEVDRTLLQTILWW